MLKLKVKMNYIQLHHSRNVSKNISVSELTYMT